MMCNIWDTVHFALKILLLIKKVNNLKDFNYVIADEIVKSHLNLAETKNSEINL